ncbi:MAG: HPr family phosphocarrier protein [Pseudomonadota bacterium]
MSAEAPSRTARIANERGLHARAAAKFVETACKFDAVVTVARNEETVNGSSIMGLLMLGAGRGVEVRISAEGPEAEEAVAALVGLIEAKFYED